MGILLGKKNLAYFSVARYANTTILFWPNVHLESSHAYFISMYNYTETSQKKTDPKTKVCCDQVVGCMTIIVIL